MEKLLARPEDRRAALAHFAPLRLSKVYLEGAHRGSPGTAALPLRETVQSLEVRDVEEGQGPTAPRHETEITLTLPPSEIGVVAR